jgi:ubiquinone biosynthesis protein
VIREAFADLNRVRQIAVIAARHGFGQLLDRSGLKKSIGPVDEKQVEPNTSQTVARRFRMMLAELGPTFVKLGQVLSTRGDLLPAAFIDELSVLQDDAPPVDFKLIRDQVRSAFNAELETLYAEFSPVPLAAASMAQAHRARTREGEEVIVKVQRPGIADQLRADLSVLHSLARMLEAVVEEVSRVQRPPASSKSSIKAVHEELDFLNEAARTCAPSYKNHQNAT